MQQQLRALKKFTTITIGLLIFLSIPIAKAELDLAVKNQVLEALSDAVANYENEKLDLDNDSYGSLKKYNIEKYSEKLAGGIKGYYFNSTNSVYSVPDCCEPDLYLSIFGEIHYKTNQEILDAATDQVGYWFESTFIENFTSKSTVGEAVAERQKLEKVYEDQKEVISITNKAIIKSKAFEIFANDSTLDSNFDLLEDLKDIENLLFGDNVPWETFQIPELNQESLSSPTNHDTNLEETDIDEVVEDLKDDINPDIRSSDTDNSDKQEDLPLGEVQDFTPDQCGVSPNLANELESHSSNNQNDPDSEGNFPGGQVDPDSQEDESDEDPNLDIGINLPSFTNSNPLFPEFTCYSGSDVIYSTVGTPEQRFCFYIKEVRQNLRWLTPSNNCTNCIFDSMNEKFIETNDKNLIPQKLTGNYFEPPICKKDLLNKINSSNINFIAKSLFSLSSPQKAIQEISPSDISKRFKATQVPAPEIDFSNANNFLEVLEDIQDFQSKIIEAQVDRQLKLSLEEKTATANSVNAQLLERMELFNKNLKSLQDSIFSIKETSKLFLSKPKCQ
ncbi:hypothetical protein HOJ01_03970 [bacterium]|jgi:hypothetical protein|nr:hypothetical protein [bacterium]MBT6293937.1 hypothetical protein [bacterium]